MDRGTLLPGERNLLAQIIPGRKPSADLALRQFEEHSGQGLAHATKILERHQRSRVADGHADQAVQPLVRLVLMDLEVAGWMEGHATRPPAIGVDAQRDLLRHGAARHECGRGLGRDRRQELCGRPRTMA